MVLEDYESELEVGFCSGRRAVAPRRNELEEALVFAGKIKGPTRGEL